MFLLHVPYATNGIASSTCIVTKNLEAAFLFAYANNRYSSSMRGINGLFLPQFKEIFKVTSHCLLTKFLILPLTMLCTTNDRFIVGKAEAIYCKLVSFASTLVSSPLAATNLVLRAVTFSYKMQSLFYLFLENVSKYKI